jgi:hypothetical protein
MSDSVKSHLRAFLVTFCAVAPALWLSQQTAPKPLALHQAPCDVSGVSPAPDTFEIASGSQP